MIIKEPFGKTEQGEAISLYTLKNHQGAYIKVTDLGATIVSIAVPDREGKLVDVALGYDSAEDYLNSTTFFGATVGRNANRIGGSAFSLNGQTYRLTANEGEHNLHSGPVSYNQMLWQVKEMSEPENSITFGRISPDGEQGFPANLNINVKIQFTQYNELLIQYLGAADGDTVVNMTNHSYFNLAGHDSGSCKEQRLRILADAITPVGDSSSIPTGEIRSVENTPMDFRKEKTIGEEIDAPYDQLQYGGGYDHNYVCNDYEEGVERLIAKAYSPTTGIAMDVYTDLPGVQFYTGNFLEKERGKNGAVYQKRAGFCLETQHFPNAVNQPEFPSPVVKGGTFYQTQTLYHFYCIAKA